MIYFEYKGKKQQFQMISDVKEWLESVNASSDEIEKIILDQAKLESSTTIKNEHARLLDVLSGSHTVEERDTWPIKENLVDVFLNGTKTQKDEAKQWLSKMLKKGEKVEDYVAKIQRGIQNNRLLLATAEGLKRNAEMVVESAKTAEELEVTMDAIKARSNDAETAFKKTLAKTA